MKVLIVFPYRYPGIGNPGSSRMQKFARGLRELGVPAHILGAHHDPPAEISPDWQPDGCGVPFRNVFTPRTPGKLGVFRSFRDFRSILMAAVAQAVEELAPDAIIFYSYSWYLFRPLRDLCRRKGIALVTDWNEWFPLRGGWYNPFEWDKQLYYRRMVGRLDGAVCISQMLADYVAATKAKAIRIPAIGDGQPTHAPLASARRGPFVLTYLGMLAERDLPETLFAAVRLAVQRGTETRLVVIGKAGTKEPARSIIARMKQDPILSPCVELTGFVSNDELSLRMAQTDAFVILRPDTRETRACFPTRLPEFLLTGRPVILSDAGDMPIYFRHGENAWLVPAGQRPESLADAIAELSSDRPRANAIGLAGQRTAIEQFSYRVHAPRLLGFLEALTQRGGIG